MTDYTSLVDSITKELNALPDFGQLQIHLTKHLGEFGKREVVKITSIKFTDKDPNVTATTAIFSMIKAIADNHETGTLTFSLNFKQGDADQMQVQDFRKL